MFVELFLYHEGLPRGVTEICTCGNQVRRLRIASPSYWLAVQGSSSHWMLADVQCEPSFDRHNALPTRLSSNFMHVLGRDRLLAFVSEAVHA